MGVPKATLPFGPEMMLQRVVRLLGSVVSPIVVVAAREVMREDVLSRVYGCAVRVQNEDGRYYLRVSPEAWKTLLE